ncbi:hypothetical protein V6N11_077416 [Hibiscus sabdariffa]|uniref:Uncharacterized protein n=1 Tax=Hibiscus sabdariffa TaxID=183260 RepID=A0ABR2TDR8_9ROSI
MSGSGIGPASRLVPYCSCRSKLSSLESQAIRTPRNIPFTWECCQLPQTGSRVGVGCTLTLCLCPFLHLCLVVRPDFVQNASASTSSHNSLQQCYSFFSSLLCLKYFIFPAQKTTTNRLPQAISTEITTKDQGS